MVFHTSQSTKAFDEIKSKIMYTYNGTIIFAIKKSKQKPFPDHYNDKYKNFLQRLQELKSNMILF